MENQIRKCLEIVQPLSVNSALWVIRRSFDNYFQGVFEIPLKEVDIWVKSINDENIKEYWTYQSQMKRPRLFFYGMYLRQKDKVLRERKYQRGKRARCGAYQRQISYKKQEKIVEQIYKAVMPLSFSDGFIFLGNVAGAWMLTCPEEIIRSERNVEKVGEWQVGEETAEWTVRDDWRKGIYPHGGIDEDEMQLVFVLDFLHNFAFDDYNTANII